MGILVADVSGHGVTPGLIMMMVQSAMQSIITLMPEITPQELFITMNTVIRNILRILLFSRKHDSDLFLELCCNSLTLDHNFSV